MRTSAICLVVKDFQNFPKLTSNSEILKFEQVLVLLPFIHYSSLISPCDII